MEAVYRDRSGPIRMIEFDPSYPRMVNRAFGEESVHGPEDLADVRQRYGRLAATAESLDSGAGTPRTWDTGRPGKGR